MDTGEKLPYEYLGQNARKINICKIALTAGQVNGMRINYSGINNINNIKRLPEMNPYDNESIPDSSTKPCLLQPISRHFHFSSRPISGPGSFRPSAS